MTREDHSCDVRWQFGDYVVFEEIGRGGMGAVFKARQTRLDRTVALKMINADQARNPGTEDRFRREAQTAAKVQHPNIVQIHDAGQICGQSYFAMEYVEGADLEQLSESGPLPPEQAARYVAKVARAVQRLHAEGIIPDRTFDEAEDAKADLRPALAEHSSEHKDIAYRMVGQLHSRVHTKSMGHYYEERSQDPEKVLQIFVRANASGQPLEYSDLLLATATARWETDARNEIHEFTDALNGIGKGYKFGKDFVLKACLYLTEELPIQYKVKNFTRTNLEKIEANWEAIKQALSTTVRLVSRFGFSAKNIVAPLALLPIAYYLMRRGDRGFDTSSSAEDAAAQVAIRRWLIFSTLKNAFGGSSDTTLTHLRGILKPCDRASAFPATELYESLGIEPSLNEAEIERILGFAYQGRYTYLVLSLLYPDRDWKDAVFHEDHIFPQSEFRVGRLRKRGYAEDKVQGYLGVYNTLCNLQLLTDSENTSKNATPFDEWIQTRDSGFRGRHRIPELSEYGFDHFHEFVEARRVLIVEALQAL